MKPATVTKPRLLVIAGPNGAGKTTVTERGLAHEWFAGCEYINPDFIARDEFGDWNSPDAILKAAQLATERREKYLAGGQSMAFETVFSAPDKVEFLHRAHQQGYFIRVFFVATADPAINASRVARRVMQGGHDVPIPKIISRYFRSIAQCAVIAPWVDRLYLYDNSIDGTEAALILRATEGKITKLYQPAPEWMVPIIDVLESTP
ncbi:zeta toxin family protein [Methylomonas koyamae]|uniref:AAA family ATPase n=1 Tax=Methylomonas koyamae TaxID=702114 RepID=A0AA91DB67_9GAMM|nr:zeta toxin family protein [Methylomonas koyamae]OAI23933.1 AAA family ATPase [Methylomonas koyamae]